MDDIRALIVDYIQKTSQAAAYALGDLLEPLDLFDETVYLAVMQLVLETRKKTSSVTLTSGSLTIF